MELIDGRAIAQVITAAVKKRVAQLPVAPGLAVVLVGADPASHVYVGVKEKACRNVGMRFQKKLFFASTPQSQILEHIKSLNANPAVTGILVQLPLPAPLDETTIIGAIDPAKDADGFHPENLRRFAAGDDRAIPSLTRAIGRLLESTDHPLPGDTAVIVANSEVFAQPLTTYLNRKGAVAKSLQPTEAGRVPSGTGGADILIVAVGRPKFIRAEHVKPDATVIDVGTNRVGDAVVGDVDTESVKATLGRLSPVPGGVGPVTVATLLERVVELAEQ